MPERPVLTIFAGPNGSGKSTLTREFMRQGLTLGTYINADEAMLFDNSGTTMRQVAHLVRNDDGSLSISLTEPLPLWVMAWANEIAPLIAADPARTRH